MMMRGSFARLTALVLVFFVAGLPTGAGAFSVKGHLATANQALLEVGRTPDAVWLRGFAAAVPPDDRARALEAIAAYPSYFRAGALGPDFFPDLIGGQIWVHPNRGRPLASFLGTPACQITGTCIPSSLPMQERAIEQWRSSDYGMYLLRRALLLPSSTSAEQVARKQALAFAYGYLSHMLADGFSHAWVNEWTGDTFDAVSGGGLFGTISEEVKHVAVEKYLDRHLKAMQAPDLTVSAPTAFLNQVYSGAVADPTAPGVVLKQVETAGAFAGVYFEELLALKDLLDKLSDRNRWDDLVDPDDDALRVAVQTIVAGSQPNVFLGIAGQTLDPLKTLEEYFKRRAAAVDALAKSWVLLSSCVAQNLVLGSNALPDQGVGTDACQAIQFEATTGTGELFNGQLDAAAWWGKGQPNFDYGSLSANLVKMEKYVMAVAQFALSFSILDDVVPVKELFTLFGYCNRSLLTWPTCADACTDAEKSCVEIVQSVKCFVLVACFLATDEIVDAACSSAVAKAAPICGLCTDAGIGGVCATLEGARNALVDLPMAYDLVVQQVLQPAIDEAVARAKRRLLEAYAGPYAEDFIEAFREMDRSWKYATPAWMVNMAFLRDDLNADPNYLNRLVTTMLGLKGNVASNAALLSDAVTQTASVTASSARTLLNTYVQSPDQDAVWRGLLTVLYQAKREPLNLVAWLAAPEYAWLDSLTLRTSRHTYENRLAKFMALMAELQRASGIRGPTVLALRASLGLEVGLRDPLGSTAPPTPFQIHQVPVTHNTIEAIKVGLISPSGLAAFVSSRLGAAEGVAARPAAVTSTICKEGYAPHTACDVVKSLDDPSNIREPGPLGAGLQVDPELGVARWYSNKYQWSNGGVWQPATCSLALTYFPLATTASRAVGLYDKVFRYPPTCPQPGGACTPTTCEAQGKTCGVISDGCNGGWIGCGTCPTGQMCLASNTCCTPRTMAAACAGRCTGTASDGCGGTIACDWQACGTNQVCGSSGTCTLRCPVGYQSCEFGCAKICP